MSSPCARITLDIFALPLKVWKIVPESVPSFVCPGCRIVKFVPSCCNYACFILCLWIYFLLSLRLATWWDARSNPSPTREQKQSALPPLICMWRVTQCVKCRCHCQLSPVSWLLRNVRVGDSKICGALKLCGKQPKFYCFSYSSSHFNVVEKWDIFLKELMGDINFLNTANMQWQHLWTTKLSICQAIKWQMPPVCC